MRGYLKCGTVLANVNIVINTRETRWLTRLESILRQVPALIVKQSMRVSAPRYTFHQHPKNLKFSGNLHVSVEVSLWLILSQYLRCVCD
jgi:hypothetical protein